MHSGGGSCSHLATTHRASKTPKAPGQGESLAQVISNQVPSTSPSPAQASSRLRAPRFPPQPLSRERRCSEAQHGSFPGALSSRVAWTRHTHHLSVPKPGQASNGSWSSFLLSPDGQLSLSLCGLPGGHYHPIPDSLAAWGTGQTWRAFLQSSALLPRMDSGQWHSCWAWCLLALAVVAGGAASTEASVSRLSLSGPALSPGAVVTSKRVTLEGLCDRCGALAWVPGPPGASETCSQSQSDQPLSWGSGHESQVQPRVAGCLPQQSPGQRRVLGWARVLQMRVARPCRRKCARGPRPLEPSKPAGCSDLKTGPRPGTQGGHSRAPCRPKPGTGRPAGPLRPRVRPVLLGTC